MSKSQVKISEIFDITIEELSEDFPNIKKELLINISKEIKSKKFLLDEDLLSQAVNDSDKKELKIKVFVDDNKDLIFDFEDNGIGIQKKRL